MGLTCHSASISIDWSACQINVVIAAIPCRHRLRHELSRLGTRALGEDPNSRRGAALGDQESGPGAITVTGSGS